MKELAQSMNEIVQLLKKITVHSVAQKEVLTIEELCLYTGYAKSYIHKMTSARKIPHYKSPLGKMVMFKRDEINQWLTSNKMPINKNLKEYIDTQMVWKRKPSL